MLKLSNSVCIDAPINQTWEVLANIESLSQWSEFVVSSKSTGPHSQGVGAQRQCVLTNNMHLTERWTAWQHEDFYRYEASDLPLVRLATNTWSVKQLGTQTLVTTEAEVIFKAGIFGRLLEPLMRGVFTKMGNSTLATLKYFVEHGEPFEGSHSQLPKPQLTC